MDEATKGYLFDVLCAVDNNLQGNLLNSQTRGDMDECVRFANMISANDNAIAVLLNKHGATIQ
jgi:hypothetical protein